MSSKCATAWVCSFALLGASACQTTEVSGSDPDASFAQDSGLPDLQADAAPDAPADAPADTAHEALGPLQPGSFNLQFGSVTLHDGGYTEPASKNLEARLDISVDGGAYQAVVGAQGRGPVPVQIDVNDDRVELTGDVPIAPIRCSSFDEEWRTITIPRDPSGALASTFSAEGVGPGTAMGPNGWTEGVELRMTTNGAVAADQKPAELLAEWIPKAYPEQRVLPWSTMKVQLTEGVDEASFDSRVSLRATGSSSDLPLLWIKKERGPAESAGLISASARLASWDDASADGLELHASAGILDPAGNGSLAFTKTFQVLKVPSAASGAIDLGTGPLPEGAWGKVSMLEGASASLCESASCLQIGPLSINDFYKPMLAGLAGRLPLGGKSRVAVRYRVLLDGCNDFYDNQEMMRVEVARPAEGVVATSPGGVNKCNDLGEQAAPLRYASDWTDLVIELSSSDGEAGFSIVPSMRENIVAHELMGCGHDPVGPSYYNLAILVQRVEVRP